MDTPYYSAGTARAPHADVLLGPAVVAGPSPDRQPALALALDMLEDYRHARQLNPEFSRFYEEALARQYSPPAPRRRVGDEWIVNLVGGTWMLFALLWPASERKPRSPTSAA